MTGICKEEELPAEREVNGRIISTIKLRFPVYYDGQEGNEIRMPDKNTVEVATLLTRVSNRKADSYVKLNVKMEDYYRIKDAEGDETNE